MRYVASLVMVAAICCAVPQKGMAAGSEATQLAVCPLRIYSGEDLSYLREGLLDVFISRLQVEGRVVALDKNRVRDSLGSLDPTNASLAALRELMDRLGADHLVYGSLTKLGQSVSVDVRLLETGAEAPLAFSSLAKDLDSLMPEVHALLEGVQQRVTGGRPPPPPPAVPSQAPALPSQTPVASGLSDGLDLAMQLDVPFQARGLGVGDVDGDGALEIVLADSTNVYVYRQANGELELAAEHAGKGYEDVIHLDVGDVDGNGRAEIFVTSVRDGPRSFVLEWADGGLTVKAVDLRYFLRIFPGLDGTPHLVGQSPSGEDRPFSGARYPLGYRDGAYVAGAALPGTLPLYHYLPVDLAGDGEEEVLLLDGEGRLIVADGKGEKLWRGGAGYGGACVFYSYVPAWGEDRKEHIEIPVRMLAVAAGKGNQVFVASNSPSGLGGLFGKASNYGGGKLAGLEWTGTALRRTWANSDLAGCVVDWQVGDVIRGGRNEVVLISTDGGVGLLPGGSSSLQVYMARPR